ncbi:MAG: S9 family peptidase [Burkholderiales bacterium]|nr:S9 family peptidase [Burkholderiales bacterium]
MLAACDRQAQHPALRSAELPRLVPAHEFVFKQESFTGFSFSPDGTRLIWTGPSGWRSGLHVRSLKTGAVHVYRVGGSSIHWSADSRRLLILGDKTGAENHHLYRLEVDDPDASPVDITPYRGVRVWLYRILESDPEHVLVLHNRRDPTLRDLYRINLSTGAEEALAMNPGDGVLPLTDANGKVFGWRKATSERARGKPLPPELRERSAVGPASEEVTRPVGLSRDQAQAWVLTNRGRDRVALVRLDRTKGIVETLYEDPHVDVGRVLMSEVQRQPLLAIASGDYPRTVVFDPRLAADLEPLLDSYRGTRIGYDIASMDPSEQRLVVAVSTYANRRYYLVDRTSGERVLLGETRGGQFSAAMAQPEAVRFQARDGLSIPGYLLRPPGTGSQPLPLVVLVHGGPWSRVAWGDPDKDLLQAQFLANRGYAVLAINYRGSTGFGRSFMTAAVGQFGARMQDDLSDGVRWAIERGIADPARIAIMGHSYGGYATLMALARTPQLFACGIDIAGPTDLARLIETFPPYWEHELSHWYSYVGDPKVASDRARMESASPVNLTGSIERPLLVIQGEKDVRVPAEQSRSLVEQLRHAGKRVEYVAVDDMGHSLGYWAHHLLVLRRAERFLAQCLGGRAARFDRMEWIARLSGRLSLW